MKGYGKGRILNFLLEDEFCRRTSWRTHRQEREELLGGMVAE